MRYTLKFYGLGLMVAGLEEYITQGVLKDNLSGWIIPTIIAFLPFLIIVHSLHFILERRVAEHVAACVSYVLSGVIGLAVEWFLIGLSPWRDPAANPFGVLILQIGMFSFWCAVAFAPRLLLDRRLVLARIRRSFKWFFIAVMSAIYGLTFALPKSARFGPVIVSVILAFFVMNLFYLSYLRRLKSMAAGTPANGSARSN
jgi:hypothetical protein